MEVARREVRRILVMGHELNRAVADVLTRLRVEALDGENALVARPALFPAPVNQAVLGYPAPMAALASRHVNAGPLEPLHLG